MKRNVFLAGAGALAAATWTPAGANAANSLATRLASIEASTGGRLGVAVESADGDLLLAYRQDERFAMGSTFKFLAVAAVADVGRLLAKII